MRTPQGQWRFFASISNFLLLLVSVVSERKNYFGECLQLAHITLPFKSSVHQLFVDRQLCLQFWPLFIVSNGRHQLFVDEEMEEDRNVLTTVPQDRQYDFTPSRHSEI